MLPSAKRVGKDFASNLLPEVFDVVTGGRGEATTSSTIKKAVKRAAGKTVKKQLGTGAAKKKRRQSVGKSSKTKNSRTARKGRKKLSRGKTTTTKKTQKRKKIEFFQNLP